MRDNILSRFHPGQPALPGETSPYLRATPLPIPDLTGLDINQRYEGGFLYFPIRDGASQVYESSMQFPISTYLFNYDGSVSSTVPPELFDNILSYVGPPDDTETTSRPLWRRDSTKKHDVRSHPLEACSLVCRHWAERCRSRMFSGRTLVLSSYDDAKVFQTYTTNGSTSLTPVYELIDSLTAVQEYGQRMLSFCHLLNDPRIANKLNILRICGPIPPGFPRFFRLDSPHWSVPPNIVVTPSLLRFPKVDLSNIHLPSLTHVIRYLKHLAHAEQVNLDRMTWNTDGPGAAAAILPRSPQVWRNPAPCEHIAIAHHSTNNAWVCVAAAIANRNCPLRILPYGDYRRLCSWVRSQEWPFICADEKYVVYSKPLVITTHELLAKTCFFPDLSTNNSFIFYDVVRRAPEKDAYQHRLVGAHAHPSSKAQDGCRPIDPLPLLQRLEGFETLRVIVLQFKDYETLQVAFIPYRPVLTPQISGSRPYVLVCSRSTKHPFLEIARMGDYDCIGLDPVTLSPTGSCWINYRAIVPSLLDS
ncbi:hypothetical protein BC629DRAFT_807679 [Irpex lacteus]|nr:hypothetical protein BC629DRAFT_807679 [Irpex lacteus]